jgi:hypothetical protein
VIVLLAIGILAASVQAQSVEERLQKFGKDYAQGYVGPLGDQFGAALNSGWYHNANVSDGVDIYIGVKAMLMPLPDKSKTFNIQSPWPGGGVDAAPTVFGPDNDVAISGAPANADPHTYAQGLNLNWSVLPVPHISVGNIFGTRLLIRFLPQIPVGDAGKLGFFGIGAQHSISRYIPLVPIDISAHVAYSSFTLGDLISATGFNFGVEASKSFAILTVYGGLGYETSKFSFSYTASYTDPTNPGRTINQNVGFDINGTNSVRATIGFTVSLGFLKLNADYSAASQSVIVVGLGVGI